MSYDVLLRCTLMAGRVARVTLSFFGRLISTIEGHNSRAGREIKFAATEASRATY